MESSAGEFPERFAIFLKYLLEENPESLIYQFLKLQFENPEKRDCASSCFNDLRTLEINLSLEEIENMTKKQFKEIVKKAFEYLENKCKSKEKGTNT